MDIRSTSSSRAARAGASVAFLLAVVCAPLSARATAQPVHRYTAPFDCASDVVARQTGLLVGPLALPNPPTLTHGCLAVDPGPGAFVWSWYTAPVDATIVVVAVSQGDAVCVFIAQGPCVATASARVTGGETYAVGASLAPGGAASAVLEIDVLAQ